MALTDKLKAIGDAIREKTGKTDLIPLDQMPQEIESIKTETYYDLFWDTYQDYGKRRRYRSTFNCDQDDGKQFWTLQTLRPKYSFGNVTMSTYMFYHLHLQVDFMEYFKKYVPDFNFSLEESTDNNLAFCWSFFTHLPVLDLRKAGKNNDMILGYAKCLQSVKLIVDNTVTSWMLMRNCDDLREIEIEGELCSQLWLDTSYSLQKESINNIFKVLSDKTSGLTLKFPKGLIDRLYDTEQQYPYNGSTSEEWFNLIDTKPNWNISLL